jgi:hypothetical protein
MQCINRYYYTRQRFPHLANAFKYALSLVRPCSRLPVPT